MKLLTLAALTALCIADAAIEGNWLAALVVPFDAAVLARECHRLRRRAEIAASREWLARMVGQKMQRSNA